MVPKLRSRHRIIWFLWALILPIGFVASVLVIPDTAPVAKIEDTEPDTYQSLATQKTDQFSISILQKGEGRYLHVTVLEALNKPSSYVFLKPETTASSGEGTIVGRIDSGKDHLFPIHEKLKDASAYQCTFKDIIHNETYLTLTISL